VPQGRHDVLFGIFLWANLVSAAVMKLVTVNLLTERQSGGTMTVSGVVFRVSGVIIEPADIHTTMKHILAQALNLPQA